MTIRVVVPTIKKVIKKTKSSVKARQNLDGYTEIASKYLKHVHGAWIRYFSESTNETDQRSGGFLVKIIANTVFLRAPVKNEIFEINLYNTVFYVKKDNENYVSLQEMIMEKNKNNFAMSKIAEAEKRLAIREKLFLQKNERYLKLQAKLYKLVLNGKMKIVV